MDIQEIARRARLPARKVRYVVDQRLLPGLRGKLQNDRAGRPRSYTPLESYSLACAALLLAGGAQRGTVSTLMSHLLELSWPLPGSQVPSPTPLQRVLPQPRTVAEAMYGAAGNPALILLGDGVNLRLHLRGIDTGWIEPRSRAHLEEGYRPSVVLQLDLVPLSAAFDRPLDGTGSTPRVPH